MNPISKEDLKDQRQIATLAVESALTKKNFQNLADLVELADKYGVNKRLRFKAWKALGMHWMEGRQLVDASIALNSARRILPLKTDTVKLLFECVRGFVGENKTNFSVSDLSKIEGELERILEFYKLKKLWNHPATKAGRILFREIAALKQTAKDVVETPATHKTDRIVTALRSNVSFEEVKADYARIIAPVLRELMAKEIDEEKPKKKKKKRGKKAPSKDPESTEKKDGGNI